jgi:hypothetical protein
MNADEILLAVIDALNAETIPYLLAGSFSSNYYGIPRSTLDADFVIELQERSVMSLQKHLPASFRIDPQVEFETITMTRRNLLRVAGTSFKVELFRLSDDPHDQERFRRRQCVPLFGREVFLPTAEDVIVTKLRWLRRKDKDDILNVMAVQFQALDWTYIEHWGNLHGTSAALAELRGSLPSENS